VLHARDHRVNMNMMLTGFLTSSAVQTPADNSKWSPADWRVPALEIAVGAATQQPTSPTLCTAANQGRCDCANLQTSGPFVGTNANTYTWWLDGQQRCLTTYVPTASNASLVEETGTAALPTMLYLQCYGQDRLQAFTPDAISAANRFGMAMMYLSSPDGAWSWNTSIVNDTATRPCSAATAGVDYSYMRAALSFLAKQPFYDKSRVYTYGFSQNGMASAYVGRCFASEVTGQWIGGGGLFSPGHGPVPPNQAGTCDTCKYWPVFPCHSSSTKTAVQSCIQFYSNDPVTVDQHNPPYGARTNGHGLYLYDRLQTEGNDGRMLEFSPNSAQGVTGGHSGPANEWDWIVSCFGGISTQCSAACEAALPGCVAAGTAQGYYTWYTYNYCMTSDLVSTGVCAAGCTPTESMVATSETPLLNLTAGSRWGESAVATKRPATSICSA